MNRRSNAAALVAALVAALLAGAGIIGTPNDAAAQDAPTPAALARADSGRPAYTHADVSFMQGMIAHHAQAVLMAGMVATHEAGADIRRLAERIDISQRDEMAMMQRWLRERGQTVPDPKPAGEHAEHAGMDMTGMDMSTGLMPGMLTPAQLAQLGQAMRGEFDRLFLTFMIQHHQGALTMVDRLFSSQGAGQDVTIFRFASDVTADQTTEIERMQSMLAARSSATTPTH